MGFSQRNYGSSRISYIDESQADPIVEERLIGVSTRYTLPLRIGGRGPRNLIAPEIAFGTTLEQARYYDAGQRVGGTRITRSGQEVTILGVLSLRHGYIDDPSGTVQDHTWGVGAGLTYRGFGARFDWARVPQSKYLEDVDRVGFSVSVDPFVFSREDGEESGIAANK